MSIVSYAQNFEDVMLWRALGHVENGFYIDIGAQHPLIDSVSKAFYEKGWRGIHVEATPAYATLLRQDRPDEIVLQVALSDKPSLLTFYEIPGTGLSTGDVSIAEDHRSHGYNVVENVVPCITLADVFTQVDRQEAHWLKIDVEGMEAQVLTGWGQHPMRPWVLVVESTYPNSQVENYQTWEGMLLSRGYTFTYFDGLSRYYVADDRLDLVPMFTTPPNIFDAFSLAPSAPYNGPVRDLMLQTEQRYQDELASERTNAAHELQKVRERNASMQQLLHQTQQEVENLLRTQVQREQTVSEKLEAVRSQAAQREEALQELASETYRQAQTQAQAHLHTLAQHEQAFGEHRQELQTQMRNALAEANQRERALQADFAEALRQAQTQAQAHLHTLAQREHTFGQQLQELQTQMRQADKEAAQREQILRELATETYKQAQTQAHAHLHQLAQRETALGKEISALQHEVQGLNHAQRLQAQQHDAELNTRLDEHKRLIEACAVSEAQLKAEILSGQQANLRLRQSLAQVQQSLATTHASLAWRMTAPLRALALFITPQKNLSSASLIAAEETDAVLTAARTPQSIAPDQNATIEHTMPSAEQAIKQPGPALAATLDELLACHDHYFVQCAYQTLLGRAPDPEGLMYYLGRLRTGFSKIQILSQLRLSKEGQAHATKLPGLDMAIRRYKKERYPIVGWLFRQRNGGEGKHATGCKLRAIENQLGLFNDENGRRFNQVEAALSDLHHLLILQTQSVAETASGTSMTTPAQRSEPDGLKQLSPRARKIYSQLEAAAIAHARRNA